jgi:hypothetical protein
MLNQRLLLALAVVLAARDEGNMRRLSWRKVDRFSLNNSTSLMEEICYVIKEYNRHMSGSSFGCLASIDAIAMFLLQMQSCSQNVTFQNITDS